VRIFFNTSTISDGVLLISTPEEVESTLFTRIYDVADLVVCRDEKDRLVDDYDGLIEVITATVFPTTWDEVGGPASIIGDSFGSAKVLVISQTGESHEEIVEVLKKIRTIAAKYPDAEPPLRQPSSGGMGMGGMGMGGMGMGGMGMGGMGMGGMGAAGTGGQGTGGGTGGAGGGGQGFF